MTEAEHGDIKEMYSFFDYCVEFGHIKPDYICDFCKLPQHWDDFGSTYIEFCEEHGYDSENLDEL